MESIEFVEKKGYGKNYRTQISKDKYLSSDIYAVPVKEEVKDSKGKTVHRVTTVRHVRANDVPSARENVKDLIKKSLGFAWREVFTTATRLVMELIAQDVGAAYTRSRYGKPFSSKIPGFRKESKLWQQETASRMKAYYTIGSGMTGASWQGSESLGPKLGAPVEVSTEFSLAWILATIGAYKLGKKLFTVAMKKKEPAGASQVPGTQQQPPIVVNVWGTSPTEAKALVESKMKGHTAGTVKEAKSEHEELAREHSVDIFPDTFEQKMTAKPKKEPPVEEKPPSTAETAAGLAAGPLIAIGLGRGQDFVAKKAKKLKDKIVTKAKEKGPKLAHTIRKKAPGVAVRSVPYTRTIKVNKLWK